MQSNARHGRRSWLLRSALATGAAGVFSIVGKAKAVGEPDAAGSRAFFNVKSYGATGDGKTDDSNAIQKAIDAAQNFPQGGMVFLPAGDYLVTKTLLVTGRLKIFGEGLATNGGAARLVASSLSFDVIKAIEVNGVALEGFTLHTESKKGRGGHFIRLQSCQHVRVAGVDLSGFWNGVLVDSSGDVVFSDMSLDPGDFAGSGRFALKCTAASNGNPNATTALNCDVVQSGKHTGTVDGFVLARGYNSLTAINCTALNCNRAFWATKDGGEAPNFFVVNLGTSDHCQIAVQLDDGSLNQFSDMLVTSSYVNSINVGPEVEGPVTFANCIITDSGEPPKGTGYRITSAQNPNVSITGGTIQNTGGNAIEIAGNANVIVTGIGISAIQDSKGEYGADGINISGSGNVILSGVSLSQIRNTAIRVLAEFTGTVTFSGICQQGAQRGLYDQGSSGLIAGHGCFRDNSVADVDISKNKNRRSSIQSPGTNS